MTTPKTGAPKRTQFYAQAIHVLFAIVLGQSFMLASDIMIPIQSLFEPDNHMTVMALIFAYILIVSGWVGYSRSVSIKPHKDTNLGAMRFVIDLVILFEYFYLLRISQTEHVSDFPIVVVIIFLTYMLWDAVKYREHSARDRVWIKRRGSITKKLFLVVLVATILYYIGLFEIITLEVGMSAYDSVVIVFILLILGYRASKWNLTKRRLHK